MSTTRIECPSCAQPIEVASEKDPKAEVREKWLSDRADQAEGASWFLIVVAIIVLAISIIMAIGGDNAWGGVYASGGMFALGFWGNLIAHLMHLRAVAERIANRQ